MRLIDADRLLSERMKSKYYHLPNGDIAIPIADIKHAPTIDLVRCMNCAHNIGRKYGTGEEAFCVFYGFMPPSNSWYCADGERRADE